MDLSTHEMSGMYAGQDGTQLTLLWQQYRPLLGETAELSTGAPACPRDWQNPRTQKALSNDAGYLGFYPWCSHRLTGHGSGAA